MFVQTGGEALDGAGKVSEVFKRIVAGIRSRYFIQYPPLPAETGAFRHIRVELSRCPRPIPTPSRTRVKADMRNGFAGSAYVLRRSYRMGAQSA